VRSCSLHIGNIHNAINKHASGPDSRMTGFNGSHSEPWHDGLFRFGMPFSSHPGNDPTSRAQGKVMSCFK
jgi:hypothetical protein